ncbi:MAG TPA: dihydroneopterin triphosphate diphosphatase [Gammaproteobacteria bacterium]|nr:dihydroneopterin triphosphate diphosphatase [Gammaproteobacteria bacterium]
MEYRRPESVLVVVHTPHQVLLLKRKRPPVGVWQSVTGALEWGETSAAAAGRELYEETGISTGPPVETGISRTFEIVPESRHRYAPGVLSNLEHVYVLPLPGPCEVRIDPEEHEAFQWVNFEQALGMAWSWTDRAAIESVILALPANV